MLYEVREDLGEGAFGKVVRVRRRRDGRMFVAKIMHDRGMSEKARQEVRLPIISGQCIRTCLESIRALGWFCGSAPVCESWPKLVPLSCSDLVYDSVSSNPQNTWWKLWWKLWQYPLRCALIQLIMSDPSECMQAQNEVAVLALLDHPNVVKYYECFAEQGTKVKIVMELCEVRSDPCLACRKNLCINRCRWCWNDAAVAPLSPCVCML